MKINIHKVIIAGVWVNDGRPNMKINTIKAAHMMIISTANMMKYVIKYIDDERPLTLNWFFAFICKKITIFLIKFYSEKITSRSYTISTARLIGTRENIIPMVKVEATTPESSFSGREVCWNGCALSSIGDHTLFSTLSRLKSLKVNFMNNFV